MKRVGIRIYDQEIIEKIEAIARKQGKTFSSICLTLCETNVDKLYAKEINKIESEETLIQELAATTRESSREVIGGMKNVAIDNQIQTKMLCVIYNVIMQMADGESVDGRAIECGLHDALPERFEEMLDLLTYKGRQVR